MKGTLPGAFSFRIRGVKGEKDKGVGRNPIDTYSILIKT